MSATLEVPLEEVELDIPETKVINLGKKTKKETIKRGKGRPNIHPLAGRTYLLKDEVVAAMNDPEEFAETLEEIHEISTEREAALLKAGYLKNPNVVEVTLNGLVIDTIKRALIIGAALIADKYTVVYKISKERLVPVKSALHVAPTSDTIEMNGKQVTRVVQDEFSPTRIYVYIVATPN